MVNKFAMESNEFLNCDIDGFYHTDFYGADHPNNPNFLYKLKNDPHHHWSNQQIASAINDLTRAINADLPEILQIVELEMLTVCVVPRAKTDAQYRPDQRLFKETIGNITQKIPGFQDGSNFIKRQTDTRTTHLRRPVDGFLNNGPEPYPGIAKATCHFSPCIMGLDILLVDDVYTKTVNIDEDMVQALLDNKANSVFFYAIGRTVLQF